MVDTLPGTCMVSEMIVIDMKTVGFCMAFFKVLECQVSFMEDMFVIVFV